MEVFVLKWLPPGNCPEIIGIFDSALLAHTWKHIHERGDYTCQNDYVYEVETITLNKDARFGDGWNPNFVKENWQRAEELAAYDMRYEC